MPATLSIKQLEAIQDLIFDRLVAQFTRIKEIIPCQLYLVERFVSQSKMLEKIGYCDYELAYILFTLSKRYLEHYQGKIKGASDEIYSTMKSVLEDRAKQMGVIKSHLHADTGDDLLDRFKALKQGNSQVNTTMATQAANPHRYQESVSPMELQQLLSSSKVLLIDYRARKDYVHNHIKHPNTLNIEPSLVENLSAEATSQDLEAKLRHTMSHSQFKLFEDRQKFDYVVIYNFKFGAMGNNRFIEIIKDIEQPLANPFRRLIDLLTIKNPLISSQLKLYPTYLSGGIKNWFDIFGSDAIENSRNMSSEVEMNGLVYPKSFDDYLSSARRASPSEPKRTENTPHPKLDGSSRVLPSTASTMGVQPYNPHPVGITAPISKTSQPVVPSPSPKKNTVSNLLDDFATGLVNLGNSCYMNCMIQCLAATPQLTSFFVPSLTMNGSYKQHINFNNKLGTQGILTTAFVELFMNMLNNNGKAFSPSKFKKIAGECSPGKQFASCSQQDCTEFVTFLLDGLHEDLNQRPALDPQEKKRISELTPEQEKNREIIPVRLASTIEWERYLKLNFSIIVDTFQGQYLSQLCCLECGTTSTTYNAFSILSLPIPEKLNQTSKVTLQDCIEEFTKTELLDEGNKWHCSHCKRFTRSTKKIAITRLPQVLIVNFKRFKVSSSGQIRKLETFVTYPVTETLDLTKYWTKPGTIMNDSVGTKMSLEEETTILDSFPVRNQEPPFKYKVYGVANHFGTLSTGHYTAYVYKGSKKRWCYFDDSKVTTNVSSSEVMNKNAFCVFFQRV
ncbi:DOA4 [Candida theae]|uniref:ubiquitinyl hydrolase 1 n=1 Tax=Candida theae TaxID=1198502 RepID=A0AAD5BHL6_9ASCO|nr:DOA4 [Candida theae]KAI5963843.1 DOA4 [Candida theae]